MLKAVQCDGCGFAFTVAKLAEQQQVGCPGCNGVVNIPPDGNDKNTIVGNRYQIKEIFEEGPVSNLYMAMDLDYEDYVLLRIYSWNFSSGVSNLEDFLHTLTSVSHLAEPVHIRITDQGIDDGQIYTVWPYEDLESIESIVRRSGPLSPAMAVSICKDLALSLDKAFHSTGTGHFNLTPKCIYMNSQGAVRYSDYGISAHLSNDQRFIQSGFPLWNMHFLSPEMALGWSYPDIKSDMYALASVLFYMVTGNEPYAGARSVQEISHESLQFPSHVHKELSRTFEDFFYSMTARNPVQRYTSWSEAVSKMDQFLFEEKTQKNSATSQRQRASLTRVHQQESFDSIRLNPNDRKNRPARSAKSQGGSQKRMSAEDVRRKLAGKEGEKPAMSFARNNPGSRTNQPTDKSSASIRRKSATGSRSKGPKASTGSKTKALLNSTGSHAAVSKKKAPPPPPPKKSKTTAVLVLLGIVFGLMVIGFIVIAALGKNKKPKLAREPEKPATNNVVNNNEKKTPPNDTKKEEVPKPPVEEKKTDPVVKKEEIPKPPVEEKKTDPVVKKEEMPDKTVAANPDRFKELLEEIRKGLSDPGVNLVDMQRNFEEAYPLADGVKGGKKQLDIYAEEFAPKKPLAQRMAWNDVAQIVRNHLLKREFDTALSVIDNYKGPFLTELDGKLKTLREEIIQKKSAPVDPAPDMTKNDKEKTEEMKKEEANKTPVENITFEDLAEKIASAQTSIALILLGKLQERFKDKEQSLAPLKPILEKGEEDKLNAVILEGFKKLINTPIKVTNKGQKMEGRLMAVDTEDNTISVQVNYNGRNLNRIVKIEDLNYDSKLPMIQGANEVETSLLQTIFLIRSNKLISALKNFDKYTGPLKQEIRKSLLDSLNGDAIGALMKVLELVGLTDITADDFPAQLKNLKVIKEDGWLASYLINKFKVNYSSTEYYTKNEMSINALSNILNRIGNNAKSPTVIVSETGGDGTKTLENALREAKSGDVIRILPGVYEGTLEVRQRSVSIYGATGVILNTGLRISESRSLIKQITFTNGNLSLSNDVSSVDIVNCLFTSNGVDFAGGNSGITMRNSVIYGITARSNKRTKIESCTILERKEPGNGDNNFTIKGYVNGEVKNSIILAEKNYGIRFSANEKSSCAFKDTLMFAGNALARIGDERIGDVDTFKKEVARISNFITNKPEFIEPVSGDYRLKDFSPGFLAGEDKKSMGVQMNAKLKLIDVD